MKSPSLLHCSVLLIAMTPAFHLYAQSQDGEAQYQQALKLNKSGNFQESAAILKSLMSSHPEIERYRSDYIAVASNAKDCNAVLHYANPSYLNSAPIYVQESIFSCAIIKDSYDEIDALARIILKKQGKNQSIEREMVGISLKNKKMDQALYWSERYARDYPDDRDALLNRAQVFEQLNRPYEALLIYASLVAKDPKNEELQRHYAQILLDMGMPNLTLEKIQTGKWHVSPSQRIEALRNAGAMDIRWSKADSPVAPNRFISADRAIETLKEALNLANTNHAPPDQIWAIELDLVVAYQSRRQWKQSIELYEDLLKQGKNIPSYVQVAAANSYSELHQYSKAEDILQEVNKKNPNDPEVLYDLYYSLVEQDKFEPAKVYLDELIDIPKNRPAYSPQLHINYADALIEKAYWYAYQEKYDDANAQLKQLQEIIPASTDLMIAMGSIAEWQDNHEHSAEDFSIAKAQDPTDINAMVGYANARLSSGDAKTFLTTVNNLKTDYADLDSVKKAIERADAYQGAYITGDFEVSNGTYLGRTNDNQTGDLRAYSELFNDEYRGFVRYRGLNSGPAIPANVQGVGGGIQYKTYQQEVEVEVGDMGYSRIEGTQTLNDHWSVNGSYERNAFYLFPGALYATKAGNVAGLNVNWKNNDTTTGNIGYRYWVLPDNIKQEIFGTITQRLLTEYNYKLDLSGEIGNQQNTNSNVDYFSPINQTEYSTTLDFKLLQWRNVETKKFEFWHRFYGSYGLVTQSGFNTLPMNSIGYGQEFDFGKDQSLKWGVARTTSPFNGQATSYVTGYLTFEMRLK